MIADPVFYCFAVPAVVLFGLSKGGFSGVSALGTPLVALVVPPTTAAAIILPILLVQDAVGICMFRRHWNREILASMLPGAACGIIAAYLISSAVSQAVISILLGLISIVYAVWPAEHQMGLLARHRDNSRASTLIAFASGAASGFASLIAHAGVPPFQMYVLPKRLPRDVYIGTSIIFFAATNLIKIIPFGLMNRFNVDVLGTSAVLSPVALLSTWSGARLARQFDAERFHRIIKALMLCAGTVLVLEGARAHAS